MTVTQLVQEAKRLSPRERRRLIAALTESSARKRSSRPSRTRDALRDFVSLAGKAESAYRDVSGDKYKHLGEIYS